VHDADTACQTSRPRVVVVGAGISGCACAATLTAAGVGVTFISSALDSVGQPGYGPVVSADGGGWDQVAAALAALPPVLRTPWLEASTAAPETATEMPQTATAAPQTATARLDPAARTDSGPAFFYVDRRMLSIETKRALERLPGLEFRQALVTEVRLATPRTLPTGDDGEWGPHDGEHCSRLIIGTAFGETIETDAVILAVGLSLDGRVRVGDDVLPGGRYGETAAAGLREALEALGATFDEQTVEIGPRFPLEGHRGWDVRHAAGLEPVHGIDRGGHARLVSTRPLREVLDAMCEGWEDHGREGAGGSAGKVGAAMDPSASSAGWLPEYPASPHWTEGLRSEAAVLLPRASGSLVPWLSPDGAATDEIYLTEQTNRAEVLGQTCTSGMVSGNDAPASRLGHTVTGLVVKNLSAGGRVMTDGKRSEERDKKRGGERSLGIWVTGRAGGATSYLESLASGVRVARDVTAALGAAHGVRSRAGREAVR